MGKRGTPNLTWRSVGRGASEQHLARWNPGPTLRAAGFSALDLWGHPGPALSADDWRAHGFEGAPTGLVRLKVKGTNQALPLAAARRAARAMNAAAHARLAEARDPAGRLAAAAAPAQARHLTVAKICEAFCAESQRRVAAGKLAPATAKAHRYQLGKWVELIGEQPPAIITKGRLTEVFEAWQKRDGHSAAFHACKTMCAALSWAAGRDGFATAEMPAREHYTGLKLPKPPARLRILLPEEGEVLLTAFDTPGVLYDRLGLPEADRVLTPRPSLGDALTILNWTCARVGEGLGLTDESEYEEDGQRWLTWKPSKTNWNKRNVIKVPVLGPLPARLASLRARRAVLGVASRHLVIDERLVKPFAYVDPSGIGRHTLFNRAWNAHRALAGKVLPSLVGEGTNRLGEPNLAFRPQDCRDTAATRLWRATGDLTQVSTYHGSSPQAMIELAKHYIELDPSASLEAGRQLERYAAASGVVV